MGAIGPEKILLLLVVALLLFGAKRIPEIGSSLGKGIREFKKSISPDDSDTLSDARAERDRLERDRMDRDPVERQQPSEGSEPRRLR